MLQRAPDGLDEIIQTFGNLDDPRFEELHIKAFQLPYPLLYEGIPVHRARCHKLLIENFQKAFESIKKAGFENEVKNYSGIYARRSIRGFGSHPSTHSWGIAIDLEAEKYPLGSTKRMPDQIVQCFREAGFFYGGDFKSRKDPMHFQFCTRY
ncbi:MAG TPA: M15 family metallopeptidase [Noviherbaspirillum sp.]|nr:M15 family metallopeptidase [Noviherbaspirillum sp.]